MPTDTGTSLRSSGRRIFESGRTKIAHGETPYASGTILPMPALALQIVPQRQAPWSTPACLGIGTVLRPLEIVEILPARLRAAERLPVELDVETFGGEEALLLRDKIVKPHALRGDGDLFQAHGHGVSSAIRRPMSCCGADDEIPELVLSHYDERITGFP